MGTQSVVNGCILYFIGLFIIVSLFAIIGAFPKNEVITDSRFSSTLSGSINASRVADSTDKLKIGTVFKDVFSFFFWNISFTDNGILIDYLWLIRILFVYLPLLVLLISIYYSLPFVSSG